MVVVEAPAEVRLARLADARGMSADDARARMAAQATDAERRAVADHVIVNDGDRSQLAAAVDRLCSVESGVERPCDAKAERVRRRRADRAARDRRGC